MEESNETGHSTSSDSSKSTWVLVGLYLGAIILGWGGSFATSQYVDRSLVLPDNAQIEGFVKKTDSSKPINQKSPTKNTRTIQPARSVDTYVQPILTRSIFDSTQINTKPKIPEQTDGSEPITDLNAQLLGTIVAIPAEYSLAMIKSGTAPWSKDYAVGDTLEDATIIEIKHREVIIRREDGRLEKLSLDKDNGDEKTEETKTDSMEESEDGVTKTGNNQYVVDQAVLDELLKNPEKLYSQIRAVPHKDADGNIDGYRLSGIRRKSIFYKLGVKNGDIVHGVNGKELNSMSNAMDAFNSLQNSRSFSFDVTRRRQKQTMEYEVR